MTATTHTAETLQAFRRDARVRELVRQHLDFVWRTVRRLGVPEADTDDATQDVFLVVSRRLDEIAPGAEKSFLFGTAVRIASTRRRGQRRRREEPQDDLPELRAKGPDPETLAERRRLRPVLQRALDALSLEQRTVFILVELEERTAPEVAEVLGIPVGTVASRLRRARTAFLQAAETLRRELGETTP